MDKCEQCNKHNQVFKNTDTNEKLCLWCGIKMQYELQGLKGVFRTLKLHIKNRWFWSWKENLIMVLLYIVLISLTVTSVFSLIYVICSGQHWLILNSIISLVAMILVWKNK